MCDEADGCLAAKSTLKCCTYMSNIHALEHPIRKGSHYIYTVQYTLYCVNRACTRFIYIIIKSEYL